MYFYLLNVPFYRQGIGKSCAEMFAREGALVVVTDIDAGNDCLFVLNCVGIPFAGSTK
jgi:hypothetical protein